MTLENPTLMPTWATYPTGQPVDLKMFAPGVVYKRLSYKDRYGTTITTPELIFGIVLEVMDNSEHRNLRCLEFSSGYWAAELKERIITAEDSPNLYAATPSEVKRQMQEVVEGAQRLLGSAQEEVRKKETILEKAISVMEIAEALTITPTTEPITTQTPTGGTDDEPAE